MSSGSRFALVALLALLVVGPVTVQPVVDGVAADPGSLDASPGSGISLSHVETADRDVSSGDVAEWGWHPVAVTDESAAVADDDSQVFHSGSTMRVELGDSGNARWEVTARYNLTSTADREGFQDLGAAFSDGELGQPWLQTFREGNRVASSGTDRTMRIRGVDRSWNVTEGADGNATGRLTLSFTWTNFARVADDGQRLVVGDAFRSSDGSWLSLVDGQTLVIVPPEGYTPVTGSSGDLREQSFYWEGPQSFDSEVPSAVFAGGGTGMSTTLIAALAVAGLAVVALLGYVVVSRRGSTPGSGGGGADDGTAGAAATADPAEDGEQPGVAGATDDGADPGVGGAAAGGADGADQDEIDVELLSDEERVERLLDRNGGRMKQASIVKETGWSNAKVSQLLSAMEEDGQIDKLRIGRENLISFPGEDVADIDE